MSYLAFGEGNISPHRFMLGQAFHCPPLPRPLPLSLLLLDLHGGQHGCSLPPACHANVCILRYLSSRCKKVKIFQGLPEPPAGLHHEPVVELTAPQYPNLHFTTLENKIFVQ